MRLLVSVADSIDAVAAVAGGADIIDAKDPTRGTLGPVAPALLGDVVVSVGGERSVSAAIGDLGEWGNADWSVVQGVDFVKVGFAEGVSLRRAADLAAALAERLTCPSRTALAEGTERPVDRPAAPGLVVAAYADASGRRPGREAVLEIAFRCGAVGVLLDTVDKRGPGLFGVLTPEVVGAWIDTAHRGGLVVALAGSLVVGDMPMARALGADVAGVRGAACEGGRGGRVSAARVLALAAALGEGEGEGHMRRG